jgi:hypothetical protein
LQNERNTHGLGLITIASARCRLSLPTLIDHVSEANILTMILSLNAICIRLNDRMSMITFGENDTP